MVRVVGPFERMQYPLSQRRAHFNRNKARIKKVVLHHRREKVALSEAAAALPPVRMESEKPAPRAADAPLNADDDAARATTRALKAPRTRVSRE